MSDLLFWLNRKELSCSNPHGVSMGDTPLLTKTQPGSMRIAAWHQQISQTFSQTAVLKRPTLEPPHCPQPPHHIFTAPQPPNPIFVHTMNGPLKLADYIGRVSCQAGTTDNPGCTMPNWIVLGLLLLRRVPWASRLHHTHPG